MYLTDGCFDEGPIGEDDTVSSGFVIPPGVPVADLEITEGQLGIVITMRFPGLAAENEDITAAVTSYLGDHANQGKNDTDTFSFQAEAGDRVTIRLEADPSAGHHGSAARLRLRGGGGLGDFQETGTGELPLEITATIPETGTYELVVGKIAQSDVPDNLLSFRGGYILKLLSTSNEAGPFIPSKNVEN